MSDKSPFIWQELVSTDQETSGNFFSKLLGWNLKQVDAGELGTYTLFQKEGQDIAGMMDPTPDTAGEGSYWHSYIAVDDIDKCAEQTIELGGKVLVPPYDVPDVGRICAVSDPTGAIVHLMQPVNN